MAVQYACKTRVDAGQEHGGMQMHAEMPLHVIRRHLQGMTSPSLAVSIAMCLHAASVAQGVPDQAYGWLQGQQRCAAWLPLSS